MAKGFKHGAGGVNPLNFKVIGYATEELLLAATPKENTIGCITVHDITGYHFATTQPENMAEGEVWFGTGSASAAPFNAVKKNTIIVYPISAKQMVGGALVDVTVKIYQNEKWNYFIPYLFPSEDVSWKASAASSRGTVKIGSTIEFNYTSADSAYTVATTANSQSLGEYTTLYFDMVVRAHYDNYGGAAKVGVTKTAGVTGNNVNQFSASASPKADGVRRIVSVNISNVSSGFITIHGILKATVYAVWAE